MFPISNPKTSSSLNFSSLIFEFFIQIEIEHDGRWGDAKEQQQ